MFRMYASPVANNVHLAASKLISEPVSFCHTIVCQCQFVAVKRIRRIRVFVPFHRYNCSVGSGTFLCGIACNVDAMMWCSDSSEGYFNNMYTSSSSAPRVPHKHIQAANSKFIHHKACVT